MKALNQHLAGLKDGARGVSVEIAKWNGVARETGRVVVYWPFVVFKAGSRWSVTHGPSGYWIDDARSLAAAARLVSALRQRADFAFTSPRGRKAQRAKAAVRDLLPRLQQIT